MSTKVILIGGFSETIELCEDNDYKIIGIIDKCKSQKVMGYPIIGTDNDAKTIFKDYSNYPLIVSPDLPAVRYKLVTYYSSIGFSFKSLISKKATISQYAKIGNGVIIYNNVNVSALVEIEDFVRLNVGCNIMHNSNIGSFSTVAPNSVVLGNVKLGEQAYVGSNATILPNISVANNATIGAGSVVTKNVNSFKTVKGVPAK